MRFSIQYLTIVAVLLPCFTAQADCRGNPRSAAVIATELVSGHRPQPDNPRSRSLTPFACISGEAEFVASVKGRSFLAPCRFMKETTEHLKNILANEDTNRPLALDIDHAHLAVTAEIWDEKYRNMHSEEILPALLRDTSLVTIYHSARDALMADRKNACMTRWTFAGFYDGRSVQQLPSGKPGSDPTQAQFYRTFAWFYTSINKSVGLDHFAQKKSAAIEIFFDDDSQRARLPNIVNVSAIEK